MSAGSTSESSAPACGRCGYNTTGLASLTCPECGGDLRTVGIFTAAIPARRITFPAAAALLTVLWVVAGVLLPEALRHVVPTPKRYIARAMLDEPRSGAYAGVDVYATATAWGDERPRMSVTVSLRPRPGSRLRGGGPMKVDPENGSYAYMGPTSKHLSVRSGFNGEAVAQWLAAAGLDPADARVRAEANRIAGAARHAGRRPITFADLLRSRQSSGNDPHFGTVGSSAVSGPRPQTWLLIPVLALYVAAWWSGLSYLWRMTRARAASA